MDVTRQIAGALHHAHVNGVVHRDIKPDNIIVDAGWKAHLVDFGIAKPTDTSGMENLTRQGLAVGTPHYMAPEQFRPKLGKVGPRADVYSLGAVLYHALVGHPPYEAGSAHEVLIKAATQPSPKLEGEKTPSDQIIPGDLAAIVTRTLVKKPADRYESSESFATDLARFLEGREVSANPLSDGQKLRRVLRKNRAAVGMSAMAFLVLLIIVGGFLVSMLALRAQNEDISNSISAAHKGVERVAAGDPAALPDIRSALTVAEERLETGGLRVLITVSQRASSRSSWSSR